MYRFHPDRRARGENPLQLDSSPPRIKTAEYLLLESRFRMLSQTQPDQARKYLEQAQLDSDSRWHLYQYLASRPGSESTHPAPTAAASLAAKSLSPENP